MSDDEIKRRMTALQKGTPSLSEKVNDSLTVIVGEPVQFYGLILSPLSDGEFAINTVARLESNAVEKMPEILIQALDRLVNMRTEMRVQVRLEPGPGEKH